MTANTSSAVMAQRRQPAGDLDFFPTPPWATRALCEHVDLRDSIVWEPACGRGHMARPLAEFAGRVHASDIMAHGFGDVFDFLALDLEPAPFGEVDWIITNPPFDQLHRFLLVALANARLGAAIFGRLQLLEGQERHESIYRPFAGQWTVYPFVERVPLEEGCCAPDTNSATAYAWLVVRKGTYGCQPLVHIPPCRRRLERPDDYDPPEYVARVRALKEARRKAKEEAR